MLKEKQSGSYDLKVDEPVCNVFAAQEMKKNL